MFFSDGAHENEHGARQQQQKHHLVNALPYPECKQDVGRIRRSMVQQVHRGGNVGILHKQLYRGHNQQQIADFMPLRLLRTLGLQFQRKREVEQRHAQKIQGNAYVHQAQPPENRDCHLPRHELENAPIQLNKIALISVSAVVSKDGKLLNHEKERNGHAQKHNHEKPCVQAFMIQHQQHNHHNQHERNAVKHPCSLRVR